MDLLAHLKQECRQPTENRAYQTVVIDSGDWAEELLCLHLQSKDEKQRHPDDLPYGQGGVLIAKHFSAMQTFKPHKFIRTSTFSTLLKFMTKHIHELRSAN